CFLVIVRALPRSPLFPYTTLFRSSAVLAGALAISGCTIGEGGEAESPVAEAPAEPAAQIDASVEDGSSDANPAEPVVLTASEGESSSVEMLNAEGVPVADRKSTR